uniref:Soluble scavenger receptor cysteine-rich domain-containing protein SSC5D n=1 Tax=Chelydra serpentina TaxID=8475 RepID=A0A8C3SKE8_CHESE
SPPHRLYWSWQLTQLRLVNGPSRCAGRVEVLHHQLWGTVCDDSWDLAEARVVCRQLGCGTALSAPHGSRFGQGTDRIWLDKVNCRGTEAALSECRARPWGDHNCNHVEDASVECSGKSHLSCHSGCCREWIRKVSAQPLVPRLSSRAPAQGYGPELKGSGWEHSRGRSPLAV